MSSEAGGSSCGGEQALMWPVQSGTLEILPLHSWIACAKMSHKFPDVLWEGAAAASTSKMPWASWHLYRRSKLDPPVFSGTRRPELPGAPWRSLAKIRAWRPGTGAEGGGRIWQLAGAVQGAPCLFPDTPGSFGSSHGGG